MGKPVKITLENKHLKYSSSRFLFVNNSFIRNRAYGGEWAYFITGTNITIISKTLSLTSQHEFILKDDRYIENVNNVSQTLIMTSPYIRVANTTWIGNSGGRGSILFINTRFGYIDAVFENCTFAKSYSSFLGGVWIANAISNYSIVFRGCTFIKNVAPGIGGAITSNNGLTFKGSFMLFEKCSFINNSAYIGGAIDVTKASGGNLILKDSYFEGNLAGMDGASGLGGCIALESAPVNVKIINTTFNSNRALVKGSIVYATIPVNISIENSYFINNYAFNGGLIYVEGGMTSTPESTVIKNSTMEYTRSNGDGGIAMIYKTYTVRIENSTIKVRI
jgi:predicted outer membrane repeat protein